MNRNESTINNINKKRIKKEIKWNRIKQKLDEQNKQYWILLKEANNLRSF